MSPEDAFGVVVRGVGLIAILYGISLFPGLWSTATDQSEQYLIYILFYVGAGAILISMADGIVRFAYLRSKPPEE